MLAHGYWQRRLGGDAGVLERSLTINNRPHQIVGVMPAGFRFGGGAEILLPLRVDRAAPVSGFRLLGVARLKPGVTRTQANADVVRVLHVWFEVSGASPAVRARWASALTPLKQGVVGDIGRVLWVLMGALVLVLLMACANVATLLLVQADGRRRELAFVRRWARAGCASRASCSSRAWRSPCWAARWASWWPTAASARWWQSGPRTCRGWTKSRSTLPPLVSP
jgi:hypothetical protein